MLMIDLSKDCATQLAQESSRTARTPEAVAHTWLDKGRKLPPGRLLVLNQATITALEETLKGGSLLSAADLLTKVSRLAQAKIGEIGCDFTPAQYEEIARRAEKRGITPQEMLSKMVKDLEPLLFSSTGV